MERERRDVDDISWYYAVKQHGKDLFATFYVSWSDEDISTGLS